MGLLEQARPWAHAGLARARELAHGVTLAHALHHACLFHQLCREPAALGPLADELIALAGEHGLAFWQALGRVFRGNHLLEAGQAEAGLAELGAGIAAYRETSGLLYLPYMLALLAEARRKVGDHAAGLEAIAEAEGLVEATGVRGFEPYVQRIEATLLREQGADPAVVEQALGRSIALAHKQKARLSELRATSSSPACGRARAEAATPARASSPSTPGSPRASTPPTCAPRRRCSTSWVSARLLAFLS